MPSAVPHSLHHARVDGFHTPCTTLSHCCTRHAVRMCGLCLKMYRCKGGATLLQVFLYSHVVCATAAAS
eukprot:207144-Chlamydomonas_euryale.AAC.10